MRFLDDKEVAQTTSLSQSQRRRLMMIGEFPKPIQISRRRVAWIDSEVEDWCRARVNAARNQSTGGDDASAR